MEKLGRKVTYQQVYGFAVLQRLDALRVERVIDTPQFKEVFKHATDAQKESALLILESTKLNKSSLIRDWMRDNEREETVLELMTVRQLRLLARNAGVKNYSHKSQPQLVEAIRAAELERSRETPKVDAADSGVVKDLEEAEEHAYDGITASD